MTSILHDSSTPSDSARPHAEFAATTAPKRRWPHWQRLLGLALLLLSLLIVYRGGQIGYHGWQAYRAGQELRQLAASDLGMTRLPSAQASIQKLTQALTKLERELRLFRPILHNLRWLPKYGSTIAAAPELLITGRELTSLANEGLQLVHPEKLAKIEGDKLAMISAILSTTATISQTQFAALALHAEVAQQALNQVPMSQLPPALSQRLAQLQPLLPMLEAGLQLGPVLPTLLGVKGPKTYLILVQNNQELRPTGGFISAVGKLTLDKASLSGLDFTDSYNIFREDVDHPMAPGPMDRYMGIPLLLVRDANWSPDLPTTAKLVKALYAQDTGVAVDGVITIDLHAVELLITALGPLTAPGAETPITGANIISQMKQFWAKPPATGATLQTAGFQGWWGQRKDFIPALAKLAMQRLQSGQVDYISLVQATQMALNERAIQIWVDEPATTEQLAKLDWDGALKPQPGADFLALVDMNMGYNKVNAVIKRSLSYTVTWPADATQPALATVAISYTNPITQTDSVCEAKPYYGEDYDDMIQRCYFDYVRLYVPGESKLITVDGVQPDSVSTQRGERGLRVIAGYFVLKPREQKTIIFRYQLPARLKSADYHLVLQRQSGTDPLPLTLTVGDHTMTTVLVDGTINWTP
ncbi:MAG: DUF4012 domain-containing protein [Chloroflexi bacterium]|nr:DUF4012 domain-containing protein [Chloroflexota bacterium]